MEFDVFVFNLEKFDRVGRILSMVLDVFVFNFICVVDCIILM